MMLADAAGWVLAVKILGGALVGGVAGYVISHAKSCSTAGCDVRGPRIYYTLAGAVFGAGVAWVALS